MGEDDDRNAWAQAAAFAALPAMAAWMGVAEAATRPPRLYDDSVTEIYRKLVLGDPALLAAHDALHLAKADEAAHKERYRYLMSSRVGVAPEVVAVEMEQSREISKRIGEAAAVYHEVVIGRLVEAIRARGVKPKNVEPPPDATPHKNTEI